MSATNSGAIINFMIFCGGHYYFQHFCNLRNFVKLSSNFIFSSPISCNSLFHEFIYSRCFRLVESSDVGPFVSDLLHLGFQGSCMLSQSFLSFSSWMVLYGMYVWCICYHVCLFTVEVFYHLDMNNIAVNIGMSGCV